MPQLLVQAPPWVRGVFDHAWAPMQALTRQVSSLPDALCDYLMACEVGFLAICPGESRYQLGPGRIRDREVQNVAYVSVEDLAHDNERPLHVIGHLIDHHLGCGGDPKGPWLTDGGGATPGWQEAGGRLPGLFALGYGPDEIALSDVRNYFAQSLALYCRERQRLNVADPQIHKWFRSVLWNKGFWRAQERQRRKGSR
ncbi:MAG: hypothetical protein PVH17_10405 [Anaerolineae bacterium]